MPTERRSKSRKAVSCNSRYEFETGRKVTLLTHLAKKNRTYVALDNADMLLLEKEEPEFLERFKPPVLIDEVQYAQELFSYIKMYVDKHKKAEDFWLMGSQQFRLIKGVTESLAGRVSILSMLGLSWHKVDGEVKHDAPLLLTAAEINPRLDRSDYTTIAKPNSAPIRKYRSR